MITALALYTAGWTLVSRPEFLWLTTAPDEVRLEIGPQPGGDSTELEGFDMDEVGFTVPESEHPAVRVDGPYAIVATKSKTGCAGAEWTLGFQEDPRSGGDLISLLHAEAKLALDAGSLTKELGLQCEIVLKQVDRHWFAEVKYEKKVRNDAYLYVFTDDRDKYTLYKFEGRSSSADLGMKLPEPLCLGAIVFEEKKGIRFGEEFDNIQHATTLTYTPAR